ncbi:MAG: D-glucuronyl C5-epimerase family protein [Thermoleophilaceae bacterium]
MTLPRRTLLAGALACVALLTAAPAQAGDVILVDGDRAERVEDPLVPAGPAVDVAPARATAGVATTARRSTRSRQRARASSSSRRRARARAKRARRATSRALRRAVRREAISPKRFRSYRRIVMRARRVLRRLRGARGRELGAVVALVDRIALRHGLRPSRLPALMLTLRRNTQYWPRQPFPYDRDHVMFRGSRIVFEYYAGEGLQLQPLVNFKQANLMHGACVKDTGEPCDRRGLRRLLRELLRTAAHRGGSKAWEYYFEFGGGTPPWISGMAQATAIQALARASDLLADERYLAHARASLGAFEKPPPAGVRTTGPFGGTHYLQYSFAPRLYIVNAFLQSLIGLWDYAQLTGDRRARRLFDDAEPHARRELIASDIGDWSTYSYRGAESTREYHELLREFAASLCSRLRRKPYCEIARDFLAYTTDPAEVELLGPVSATKGEDTRVRFFISKLSAVQVTITRAGKAVYDRTKTFRRGEGSVAWTPRRPGPHRIRVAAKELRTGQELRTSVAEPVEVARP